MTAARPIGDCFGGLIFDALPEQTAPLYRYADEHVLEPCWQCDGSGKVRVPEHWPRWRVILHFDPTCPKCHGAKQVVRYVGKVTDL